MKTSSLLLNSAIAGMILSGAQAFAATTNFSETIPNIDYEIEGQTYKGTFTDANLKSSTGAVFNNTKETITSGTVDLTILNDTSLPVTLTIDGISQNLTPTYSGETLAYTLTSAEDSYIQGLDGTFNYSVVVDCETGFSGTDCVSRVNSQHFRRPGRRFNLPAPRRSDGRARLGQAQASVKRSERVITLSALSLVVISRNAAGQNCFQSLILYRGGPW